MNDSIAYKWSKAFFRKMKIWARHSFLGKVTKLCSAAPFVGTSRAVGFASAITQRTKRPMRGIFSESSTSWMSKVLLNGFRAEPLKGAGIVILAAASANTALFITLSDKICLMGVIYRLAFLGVGAVCLFSSCVGCNALIDGSFFMKKLRRRR